MRYGTRNFTQSGASPWLAHQSSRAASTSPRVMPRGFPAIWSSTSPFGGSAGSAMAGVGAGGAGASRASKAAAAFGINCKAAPAIAPVMAAPGSEWYCGGVAGHVAAHVVARHIPVAIRRRVAIAARTGDKELASVGLAGHQAQRARHHQQFRERPHGNNSVKAAGLHVVSESGDERSVQDGEPLVL